MTFTSLMDHVAQLFEAVGVLVLVLGLVWSIAFALRLWSRAGGRRAYQALRETFGGVLLLGLEILVAADLIRTVAVAPTLENVLVLGLIVLIRTFLSFSLQLEIDGRPPWRAAVTSGASTIAAAVRKDRSA
ncbi:DUF1622 domain-containing protein [Hamadaea tsunoensis]|uniref:DUF1622 domain-containing protein n=1 Tax=Hamadaea tsunoensis TaxID=53368 RepID=UPI0004164FA1|nr:DUF1622 domain-containing protein [Hamadaea tsunoensis]